MGLRGLTPSLRTSAEFGLGMTIANEKMVSRLADLMAAAQNVRQVQ